MHWTHCHMLNTSFFEDVTWWGSGSEHYAHQVNQHSRPRQRDMPQQKTIRPHAWQAARTLPNNIKEHCPKAENNRHKLHMSQRKATGDDANRWMMRRRPCPAALDGDREQRASRSAVASRVGTQVPLNQSLGKPAWCARRRWSVCTQAA